MIKHKGGRQRRIRNTAKAQSHIDPKKVARILGADQSGQLHEGLMSTFVSRQHGEEKIVDVFDPTTIKPKSDKEAKFLGQLKYRIIANDYHPEAIQEAEVLWLMYCFAFKK